MDAVFVDTGAWFALVDRSDQHHESAMKVFSNILPTRSLFTSNLVVSETYILIRRALGHGAAIRFLESVSESPRIKKVYSTHPLEEIALEILRRFSDQDFSYADAVSFAIMRQLDIKDAFAFDKHFATAGFSLLS